MTDARVPRAKLPAGLGQTNISVSQSFETFRPMEICMTVGDRRTEEGPVFALICHFLKVTIQRLVHPILQSLTRSQDERGSHCLPPEAPEEDVWDAVDRWKTKPLDVGNIQFY